MPDAIDASYRQQRWIRRHIRRTGAAHGRRLPVRRMVRHLQRLPSFLRRYRPGEDSPFQRTSSVVLLFEATELSKARRARSQVQPGRMFQRKLVFSNILQRLLVRTPLTFRIRICFYKKLSNRFHSMLGFNQISGLKCRDRVIIRCWSRFAFQMMPILPPSCP